MDYAEDRLDRKAWQQDRDLLYREFDTCWSTQNHGGLGRLCLSLGWNRQAVFHYAVQWMQNPTNVTAAADYAQMAELSGFAEIGLLALLIYRNADQLLLPPPLQPCGAMHEFPTMDVLEKSATEMEGIDCGCGYVDCGMFTCFLPMHDSSIQAVLDALENYCDGRMRRQLQRQLHHGEHSFSNSSRIAETELLGTASTIPTAHEILGLIADRKTLDLTNHSDMLPAIPDLLQFWKDGYNEVTNASFGTLIPVVKLLLIKLLYLTIPALAVESVVNLQLADKEMMYDSNQSLAAQYKSHWAYYVFVHSLVLAERIKPSRRRMMRFYHIPLWNRLWSVDVEWAGLLGNFSAREPVPNANQHLHTQNFLSRLLSLTKILRHAESKSPEASKLRRAWMPLSLTETLPQIYLMGDSHVLSLAWQTIHIRWNRTVGDENSAVGKFLIVPVLVTGLKAWHFRANARFFTHTCLQTTLKQRLPRGVKTVLVSAGEIDCREGMGGPLLEGYTQSCHEHVRRTVSVYVKALTGIVEDPLNEIVQILVLPVAPHLQRSKGRVVGQSSRRETMIVWNNELRQQLPVVVNPPTIEQQQIGGIYLLDYAKHVQVDGDTFALNPAFNADSTHMNSAFIPFLEQAFLDCKCDLSKLVND